MKPFVWKNEVRAHEVDVQGIVNNAHYLSYFDHARTLHLKEIGLDWSKLSSEGFDLVLTHTDIRFSHPLRTFDMFEVVSTLEREGRLKLMFRQRIFNTENTLICTGINTVVCVDRKRNRPISIEQFFPEAQAT